MSCPFYGASIVSTGQMVRIGTSNRCALVTGSHSPCWMEVSEAREPDWKECPRSPEYVAMNVYADGEPTTRIVKSVGDLAGLMRMRPAGT